MRPTAHRHHNIPKVGKSWMLTAMTWGTVQRKPILCYRRSSQAQASVSPRESTCCKFLPCAAASCIALYSSMSMAGKQLVSANLLHVPFMNLVL